MLIKGQDLHAVVDELQSESFGFNAFVDLCGVDYLDKSPRFEVVIHLYSPKHKGRIRIRVMVPDVDLSIPSITSYWKGANWQEREAFDMYGIKFKGHPKLERILSPPGSDVFAQRKDYPLIGGRAALEDLD